MTTFDEEALLARASGDPELVTAIIGIFLQDCPVRLAAIQDAVTRGDAEALRTSAHALKGAAGNLSASRVCHAVGLLEQIGAEARMDAAPEAWQHLSDEAGRLLQELRARVGLGASAPLRYAS